MNWWMRWSEELVKTGIALRQLTSCDPAQIAFEIQALLGASSHQHRLRHDPETASRGKAAILHRLETRRAPHFPALAESSRTATATNAKRRSGNSGRELRARNRPLTATPMPRTPVVPPCLAGVFCQLAATSA